MERTNIASYLVYSRYVHRGPESHSSYSGNICEKWPTFSWT